MFRLIMASTLAITVPVAAYAGETPFTPDAAATWSARTLLMAKVKDDARAGLDIKQSMKTACDGLTGEQIHHEYGKEPRSALVSQMLICSAYDGWAGKFQGSKRPCDSLQKGLKELDNLTAQANPPEVQQAAEALRATANALLAATEDHKHGCKL